MAKHIVALMPPRVKHPNTPAADDPGYCHYVEPYAGGLSVLLTNDPVGISEVVNDLNGPLTNFWNVIGDPHVFPSFQRMVEAIPFSEDHYSRMSVLAKEGIDSFPIPQIREAVYFFVRCRQSLSGRMKGFAGITRSRTRQGMNEQVAAWLSCVEGLPEVHARLKRVLIRNIDAVECIKKEDGKRTLFYLDAPYVHSSRKTTGEYKHEMTDEQHRELIATLLKIEGRAMVSMYHHEIYDVLHLKYGWRLVEFDIANHSSSAKSKERKTECLWMNYPP